jgi:hypothetical protein
MCRFNSECLRVDGECRCKDGSRCSAFSKYSDLIRPVATHQAPQQLTAPQSQTLLLHLLRMAQQQAEAIKMAVENSSCLLSKLNTIDEILNRNYSSDISKTQEVVVPSDESTTPQKLLEIISSGIPCYSYQLELVSELPSPAYKERAFSLSARVVDMQGNPTALQQPTFFKIFLFTTESPPKMLKINTSGDKIMRGTIETESSNLVHFHKIVIKEVTSHFRNGWFYLVVVPKQDSRVKPLIINNFVIKARKIADGTPRKRVKLEDQDSTY